MKFLSVIGKIFLQLVYQLLKIFPVHNKVILISRQSNEPSIDFLLLRDEIRRSAASVEVVMLCKTLGILSSTYYHHALRSPIKKWNELKDDELRPLIKEIFVNSQERFGAQKIKFILKQQGKNVSRAHISRLMQEMGFICRQLRLRYYSTTNRKYKVYRNRIQQNFMTETPNMVWVSDITHVHVKDKLHSIGVIIDL